MHIYIYGGEAMFVFVVVVVCWPRERPASDHFQAERRS